MHVVLQHSLLFIKKMFLFKFYFSSFQWHGLKKHKPRICKTILSWTRCNILQHFLRFKVFSGVVKLNFLCKFIRFFLFCLLGYIFEVIFYFICKINWLFRTTLKFSLGLHLKKLFASNLLMPEETMFQQHCIRKWNYHIQCRL